MTTRVSKNGSTLLLVITFAFLFGEAASEAAWWDRSKPTEQKSAPPQTQPEPSSQKAQPAVDADSEKKTDEQLIEEANAIGRAAKIKIPALPSKGTTSAVKTIQGFHSVQSPAGAGIRNPTLLSPPRVTNTAQDELDLLKLTQMQKDLEDLSQRYEDIRLAHHEQLVSLRALSSQAKIHSQVLADIKRGLPPKAAASGQTVAQLNAVDLEKYRLIRDRFNEQKSVLAAIVENQKKLAGAISSARSVPGSSAAAAAAPGTASVANLVQESKQLNQTRAAVADAVEEMQKAKGGPASQAAAVEGPKAKS